MFSRLTLFFLLLATPALAQPDDSSSEWQRIVDLRGQWRFNLGDDLSWSHPNTSESGWDEIFVPAAWEDEGYPGYDGFAWYRKHFKLSGSDKGKAIYLHLGRVDDVDEVFVNGHFLNSTGRMHPEYDTGYWQFRSYYIPPEFLDYEGDNVIAVRVFDQELGGGLIEGKIGLFERLDAPKLLVDLAGLWKFQKGDHESWNTTRAIDQGWDEITVPARWEPQGYRTYDGYAWYRKTFIAPNINSGRDLVLLLGVIDDLDEVYLNGYRIGGTGNIDRKEIDGDEYQKIRAYPFSPKLLIPGKPNVIAVRVYDDRIDGGIYKGPVGIIHNSDLKSQFESNIEYLIYSIKKWFEGF